MATVNVESKLLDASTVVKSGNPDSANAVRRFDRTSNDMRRGNVATVNVESKLLDASTVSSDGKSLIVSATTRLL